MFFGAGIHITICIFTNNCRCIVAYPDFLYITVHQWWRKLHRYNFAGRVITEDLPATAEFSDHLPFRAPITLAPSDDDDAGRWVIYTVLANLSFFDTGMKSSLLLPKCYLQFQTASSPGHSQYRDLARGHAFKLAISTQPVAPPAILLLYHLELTLASIT